MPSSQRGRASEDGQHTSADVKHSGINAHVQQKEPDRRAISKSASHSALSDWGALPGVAGSTARNGWEHCLDAGEDVFDSVGRLPASA